MEKRQNERVELEKSAILMDGENETRAYIKNLSKSGAFIVAYDRLPENTKKYNFIISKQKTISVEIIREEEIDFAGIKRFRYGLKFDDDVEIINEVFYSVINSDVING